MKSIKTYGICMALAACLWTPVWAEGSQHEPVDYVNPFIGTTNYGTTHPGALCPQGMMSVNIPITSLQATRMLISVAWDVRS